MDAPERQQVIRLAQRLAQHEGVDPSWIDYPVWSGAPPGAEAALEKAAQFREWAEAILSGELEPPAWLEREDRTEEFRDPDIYIIQRGHSKEKLIVLKCASFMIIWHLESPCQKIMGMQRKRCF